MKNPVPSLLVLFCISVLVVNAANTGDQKISAHKAQKQYTVAAYIWPSCHNDSMAERLLWGEKTGEWEIIKKGTPRFEGHYQPKQPLWGYEPDNDPKVMEKWIDAATDHGVNAFIFDWYWYNNGPFLESCLNDGFLKAKNNRKMNFYIMWANHDVKHNYWNVYRYKDDESLLWGGAVNFETFKTIVVRVIKQYFHQPNYYKINGEPVFSIFSLNIFIKGLGGVDQAKNALEYFRTEVKKSGFPGLHIQVVKDGTPKDDFIQKLTTLGINSVTQYNWGGPHREDYMQWGNEAWDRINQWEKALKIPYFANASIGWDDSPRFPQKTAKDITHYNNSPQSFATYLQRAKEYCDAHPQQAGLITIYSWNEWIEGGYLLPDMKYGFGYLEAVKDVMVDQKYGSPALTFFTNKR